MCARWPSLGRACRGRDFDHQVPWPDTVGPAGATGCLAGVPPVCVSLRLCALASLPLPCFPALVPVAWLAPCTPAVLWGSLPRLEVGAGWCSPGPGSAPGRHTGKGLGASPWPAPLSWSRAHGAMLAAPSSPSSPPGSSPRAVICWLLPSPFGAQPGCGGALLGCDSASGSLSCSCGPSLPPSVEPGAGGTSAGEEAEQRRLPVGQPGPGRVAVVLFALGARASWVLGALGPGGTPGPVSPGKGVPCVAGRGGAQWFPGWRFLPVAVLGPVLVFAAQATGPLEGPQWLSSCPPGPGRGPSSPASERPCLSRCRAQSRAHPCPCPRSAGDAPLASALGTAQVLC